MISSSSVLTIDLPALQDNWRHVASLLQEAVCAAVVKADAYGVGALEVANALFKSGCRFFFVATFEEAAELRQSLPVEVTIYVLGGVKMGFEASFAEMKLIPVLYSLDAVRHWSIFCCSINKTLPCVLKIDTGMTRLGLSSTDVDQLILQAKDHPFLNPLLLMSHLACADERVHPLNAIQLDEFKTAITKIKKIYPRIRTSLANSSGAFLGEDFHFDMVRIGAALYGICPQRDKPNPLKSVISLKLSVLQIRNIQKNAAVGYGASAAAKVGSRLAVVAGGYADGIHRTLGFSPVGMVDDQVVSAVGRISMDSCIFDISTVESNPAYIEVINDSFSVDRLIETNKFLGYEVLTSLGRRYNRDYIPAKE